MSRQDQDQKITPDASLRLDVAAKLAFPDGSVSARDLGNQAARGRLKVYHIGRRILTTLTGVRNMISASAVDASEPVIVSIQPKLSGTASIACAQPGALIALAKVSQKGRV